MNRYCKEFEGGICERLSEIAPNPPVSVPKSWCKTVCKGKPRNSIRALIEKGYKPSSSKIQMGINFTKAMKRWLKSGFKLVSQDRYRERQICCTACGNGKRCPYCGCIVKLKDLLASEKGCPDPETYPRLRKYPPRNYWAVCDEMTSVIIPARNEPDLNRTIENLLSTATGKIEIIVVLDGYDYDVIAGKRVRVIRNNKPLGRRKSINKAAKKATGDYLFHIDAHCTMSEGWDTKLKCACDNNSIATCVIKSLDDEWNYRPGQGYSFVRLDRNLQEKWWSEYKANDKWRTIEPTMAFTGCAWMIKKDFYRSLGGYDESLGEYGQDGPEWSLKVWCNGGRVVLRTDVICGHRFGTNEGGKLYQATMWDQQDFRDKMIALYGDNIDALVKRFSPVPGWDEVKPEGPIRQKQKVDVRIVHRTTIKDRTKYDELTRNLPWVTCCMPYYGRHALAEEAIESWLFQTYPNKRLLIVNDHPDPVRFEEKFENIEVQNVDPDRFSCLNDKYNYIFSQVQSEWFASWEDDDIWMPEHLTNLMSNIENVKHNGQPMKIGYDGKFYSEHNDIKEVSWPMWSCCIYQVFDNKGRRTLLCNEILDAEVHCDAQITALSWNECWIDKNSYRPTYIYRWGTGDFHASGIPLNNGGYEAERNDRQKKRRTPLLEPLKPHWKRDYVRDVQDFCNRHNF